MCESANTLSVELRDWLETYMFAGESNAKKKAEKVATFFGDFKHHKSHAVGIFRDVAKEQGLLIDDLEDDQALQDAVLSVFHSTMLTFNFSNCVKLIENNLGRGFYVQAQPILLQQLMPQMVPQPQPAQQPAQS